MTPGTGIEPGLHWWKVSALTTAPTLHVPVLGSQVQI